MDSRQVQAAINRLQAGEVILYPTETFWGLGADPCSKQGVLALLACKDRSQKAGIPLIVDAAERLPELLASETEQQQRLREALQRAFWPGPLTFVVQPSDSLSQRLSPGIAAPDGSIALRLSSQPFARSLAAACGGLLTSTSANPAGQAPAETATQAREYYPQLFLADVVEKPDACEPAQNSSASDKLPSTILDMRQSPPVILRHGAVAEQEIQRCVQSFGASI